MRVYSSVEKLDMSQRGHNVGLQVCSFPSENTETAHSGDYSEHHPALSLAKTSGKVSVHHRRPSSSTLSSSPGLRSRLTEGSSCSTAFRDCLNRDGCRDPLETYVDGCRRHQGGRRRRHDSKPRCAENLKDNYCVLGAQNFFKIAATLEPEKVPSAKEESYSGSKDGKDMSKLGNGVESGNSLVYAFRDVAFCSCRYLRISKDNSTGTIRPTAGRT